MRWSFKLAKLWGIDIYVHYTFIILLLWIFLTHGAQNNWTYSLLSLGLTLITFMAVTLHEYGHALTARRFGIPTRDITLWPFGGVATIQGQTQTPRQEILLALAGPAVNLFLTAVTFCFTNYIFIPYLFPLLIPIAQVLILKFLYWFMWSNLALMLFNLIPAFPMDGGRVLRGLFARKYDFLTSTYKAVSIGRLCAVVMGIYGLAYNHMLAVIALFIWWSGSKELDQAIMIERMRRVREGTAGLGDLLSLGLGNMGNIMSHIFNMGTINIGNYTNLNTQNYAPPSYQNQGGSSPEYIINVTPQTRRPSAFPQGKIIDAEFISDDQPEQDSSTATSNQDIKIIDIK
ncbi:MAG: site-2 protease family protein [Candidatus Bruticola sp.]